jgi:hypothetical protein
VKCIAMPKTMPQCGGAGSRDRHLILLAFLASISLGSLDIARVACHALASQYAVR